MAAMTSQSRRIAGIVLIVFPTVVFGGVSVLTLLVHDPTYADNALRQDLWRAGHAHAGVLLLLTLVVLHYVDETGLSEGIRWYVRLAVPAAAVLLPIAFFLSVLSPDATQPTPLVYLAYVGAALLVTGLLILGIGLLRAGGRRSMAEASDGPSRPKVVSTPTQIRSRSEIMRPQQPRTMSTRAGQPARRQPAPVPPAQPRSRSSPSSLPRPEPWQWARSQLVPWRSGG